MSRSAKRNRQFHQRHLTSLYRGTGGYWKTRAARIFRYLSKALLKKGAERLPNKAGSRW